jgi:probable HAF family extracellular repeat protein
LLVDLAALVVVGATVVGSGAAAAARYVVVDLGTLGGNSSSATAINDSGVVVGTSRLPGSEVTHAFLFSGGEMWDLGTLSGYPNSGAAAVNSAGEVVGYAWRDESSRAFRSDAAGFREVPGLEPGSPLTAATGISDAGEVVGSWTGSEPGSRSRAAVVGTDGARGVGGASAVSASGINSAGDVVGAAATDAAGTQAFLDQAGTVVELGVLGPGGSSVASAVSSSGAVVGWSTDSPGGVAHAFLYADGLMVDLGLPRDTESEARAVNSAGQVVGDFFDAATGRQHAFLYANGEAFDLNELVGGGSGWILEQATGINDRGEIVGVGTHDGATRAFLLEPAALRQLALTARPAARPAAPAARAQRAFQRALLLSTAQEVATTSAASTQIVFESVDYFTYAVDPSGRAYGTPVTNNYEVMRSSDEGRTWTHVYSFPASSTIYSISALSDGTLLASVDTGAWTIWRSADSGSSWTQVLSLPQASVGYRTLTSHSIAEGDGYVWLGTYNNGNVATTNYVYRSADDGRTWSVTNTTSTHRHIHGLGFNPANGKLYVFFGDSDGDGIWVSSDDGRTLSPLCTLYACVTIDAAFDPTGTRRLRAGQLHLTEPHRQARPEKRRADDGCEPAVRLLLDVPTRRRLPRRYDPRERSPCDRPEPAPLRVHRRRQHLLGRLPASDGVRDRHREPAGPVCLPERRLPDPDGRLRHDHRPPDDGRRPARERDAPHRLRDIARRPDLDRGPGDLEPQSVRLHLRMAALRPRRRRLR